MTHIENDCTVDAAAAYIQGAMRRWLSLMSDLEISAGQQKLLVDFVCCHVCSSTSEKIA